MDINPQTYNLTNKVRLEDLGENHIGIVKLVKSRIIRKDALKLIEFGKAIQETSSDIKVSLICSRNICSKSIAALKEAKIDIIYIEE